MKKFLATLLAIALITPSFPLDVFAANTQIRQEVNITDGYLYAGSGAYATSSAIAAITDSNYSEPRYYFEVVASTTAGTSATVALVNTSGTTITSVTVDGGNTYQRYRSAVFMPSSSSTLEYKVRLGNEAIGKGLIASRIVVLQNAASLSTTETQIEIGNGETYTSTATTTFATPKYWYFDSTKWDASPTVYAEVTYANTVAPTTLGATTTNTFTQTGYSTVTASSTLIDIAGWGGGGAGKTGSSGGGGDGGGGGAMSSSTQAFTIGDTIRLFIGAGGALTTVDGATTTASTTAPTAIIVADGGKGGKSDASVACGTATGNGGKGGLTGISTGTTKKAGGNGGSGCNGAGNADQGGGGGGAAGPTGNGGAGSDGSSTVGGGGGGGNGGSAGGQNGGGASTNGGAGGNGGNAGDGAAGTANTNGAGGGGGGDNGTNAGAGTASGAGGGGGENAFGAGGNGAITLTFRPTVAVAATTTITLQESDGSGDGFTGWADKQVIVSNGVATSPTRVRSTAFTPTHGRNYRIVFSSGYSGSTFAIYNAKIIVTQGVSAPVSDPSSNQNATVSLGSVANYTPAWGESFTGISGILTKASFYLKKSSSPTGNANAAIYTSLNNPNCSSGLANPPSGAALATSDTFNVATLTTSFAVTDFNFSGANQISISKGTCYVVTIQYNGGDASNFVVIGADGTPNYSGNLSSATADDYSSWANNGNSTSLIFYVYTNGVTKTQPQYLLAPSPFAAGTSLQKYLTSWLSTEWSTTNGYVFQGEAANNSTSAITANSADGTLIANSTISSIDNRATSTLMCMPADGNLDTIATTNGGDIYAARILVDVGTSDSVRCAAPARQSGFQIINGLFNVSKGKLSI